ncbi:MAG: NlpC/P60 family protein [Methanocella sp.]
MVALALASALIPGSGVVAQQDLICLFAEPSLGAEVVTQARLGEVATVEEVGGPAARGWVRVRMAHDGYVGWAEAKGFVPGSWPPVGVPLFYVRQRFAHVYAAPRVQSRLEIVAPLGTPLAAAAGEAPEGWLKVSGPAGRGGFVQTGDVTPEGAAWRFRSLPELRESLVRTAEQLLGVPYRWGGTTPWGIDCSGLVQLVYRLHGLVLPRDASDQARDPRTVRVSRDELLPGDLLFFANYGHVGLAISHRQFIHATTHGSPVVQISEVDDPHWRDRLDEVRRPQLSP